MAVSCNFGTLDTNSYYGLGNLWQWKPKTKRDAPAPAPAATSDAATVGASADEEGASDPPATTTPLRLSLKGYAGPNGNNWNNYPSGGSGISGSVTPASGGPTVGGSTVQGSSSGGNSGNSGNGQPVYFAGAPKTSVQGLFGLATAGSVVVMFGRMLF